MYSFEHMLFNVTYYPNLPKKKDCARMGLTFLQNQTDLLYLFIIIEYFATLLSRSRYKCL